MPGKIMNSSVDGVATVTISNEAKLNALTVAMWRELKTCFDGLAGRDDLRCVVVRGHGMKAFSAGADISEFEETRSTREQVIRFHEEDVLGCLASIADCPIPVVAAIRGMCMGGGLEIATVCDIRIAAESARLGAPVGRLGFPLAFAETQALFRLAGPTAAAELLLEGRIYSSREAYEKGIVTRVVPDDGLENEIADTVRNIAQSGLAAARSHKHQIRRLTIDSTPVSTEERMRIYEFAETDEYRQGYRAFLKNRRASGTPD